MREQKIKRFTYFDSNKVVEHQNFMKKISEIFDLVKKVEGIYVVETENDFLVIHQFLSRKPLINFLKNKMII